METTEMNNSAASSFETVWAILQDSAKQQKELREAQAETDRMMKEYFKRQEEFFKEQKEEREKEEAKRQEEEALQKKLNAEFYEKLGNFTNLFGEFTEAMIAPALQDKFQDFGFYFQKTNRNVCFKDTNNKILMEVDIILENGEKAMLIEIKTKLTMSKINYHLERLKKMREYADSHGDKRVFLGGIAGVVVPDEERTYALNQGLYLIEPAGDNFNITAPESNPKEW